MRYLDLGTTSARTSQAVYHAVAEAMGPGSPTTLITVSPENAYVCVGYHQIAGREIDRAYCEMNGIEVGRRMVGGGAVYLDHEQVFWHLLLPGGPIAVQSLYDRFLRAPVAAYRRIGIAAEHRPVNDIVVGQRKIGGTGAAQIGNANVLVGSILMDFDTAAMARTLRVPSEKFRGKLVESLDDYMTTVRRELGGLAPGREAATEMLVAAFAEVLSEPVEPSRLTDVEAEGIRHYEDLLFDPEFVYRREGWLQPGVKIRAGVRLMEGLHKAPGGLIRLVFREREGVFDDVLVSGDFFVDPPDALERLERALLGRAVSSEEVLRTARAVLAEVSMPRVAAEDFAKAMESAQTPS